MHNDRLLQKAAAECMVLMKTNGEFPLEKAGPVALYGNGVRHTKKGGTGSGDVNVLHFATIEEAFRDAGFTITTSDWLDQYDQILARKTKVFREGLKKRIEKEGIPGFLDCMGAVMLEPEYDILMKDKGDAAIYVLSRVSGEGTDRTSQKGDLLMTDTEVADILAAAKRFRKFMLVLNVGGVIDLSPVVGEVENILLLSQSGGRTSEALCDVILGNANPSGKLSATWAAAEDYCTIGEFGDREDTRYREGIYVGYRYFDTFRVDPLFPFGYGLSYTSFESEPVSVTRNGSEIRTEVAVRNKGTRSGKEVIQLYVSMPGVRMDQPVQVLAAFEKTEELAPGESRKVALSFDLRDLASYQSDGHMMLLEKGEYILRVGNSSRNTQPAGKVILETDIQVREVSALKNLPDFEDVHPEAKVREEHAATEERASLSNGQERVIRISAEESCTQFTSRRSGSGRKQNPEDACPKNLTTEELAYLCIGRFAQAKEMNGSDGVIGNAGIQVAGAAGETTGRLAGSGIGSLVMADGPAGLRLARTYGRDEKGIYTIDGGNLSELAEILPDQLKGMLLGGARPEAKQGEIFEQDCSAIPIGTALAQSFNTELAEALGELVAEEMIRYHVNLWLAPAMNIQRNPLCGRNFEYYSEDPLLSGKMAAAITRGVQKHEGCGVTIKHFACNNQETNRMRSNSIVSERALRELYLKGFEIAVRESDPAAVMTSYNLLNGEHTSSSTDLLETILREEWGYEGLVMTDWISPGLVERKEKYPAACASGAVYAGNDLIMPGSQGDYENVLAALNNDKAKYPLSEQKIRRCAGRVIRTVKRLEKLQTPGGSKETLI